MDYSLKLTSIHCPYCGEILEIFIDPSAGDQSYIEDCQVCCAPIEISIQLSSEGEITDINCKRDSD